MNPQKLKLEASLLIKDDCQHCLEELQRKLSVKNGIEKVHLTSEPPQLCLHFDPNLVSMSAVERMARDAGGELESKFHHQRFRLLSQHSADFVSGLERQLSQTTGVLHASVNAAASIIFIAYDSEQTDPEQLERALHSGGVSVEVLEQPGVARRGHDEDRQHEPHVQEEGKPCDHDHGSEHEHEDHDHEDHDHEHDHDCKHDHDHDHDHGHSHGPGCGHGVAPSFLPQWLQERWQIALVIACGVFFLAGWLGEKFSLFPGQVSLVLYLMAYLAGGYDIGTHAIPGLFKGRFNTDILMLAAAVGAGVLGQWAEGAFLLFLFALGHAGEHYAMDRARNAIGALGELMPQKALLRRGGDTVEVPISAVKLGDVALVRPGDRIPVDGVVKSGTTSVDQSPITGESAPVGKGEGDQVFAGTINLQTAIEVTVEKTAEDSTLSRVIQMVSEAQEQKSPTQDFTQRFTSRFVPAVLLLTLLVIVVPPLAGWMAPRDSFYRAMLLLVACSPCALALGTPASVLAGIGQAARNGILIKGGLHLENLGTLQVIAFDKTGTLTEGKFQLTDVVVETADGEEDLLIVAASVEQQSNHPLAQAVVEHARTKGLALKSSAPLENLTGFGVRSELDGGTAWLGSRRLFAEVEGAPRLKEAFEATVVALEEQGKTVIVVGHGDTVMGVLALADTPRREAKETLKKLSDIGLKHLVMLTGDNRKAAAYVGGELGVTDVRSELLPEDKWKAGKALQEEHGLLAMVGDGVNDAPALAAADVGIAMGGAGTAVALETADVALMGDDLSKLPYAVGLSRQSRRIIRQNLFISMGVIAGLMMTSLAGLGDLSWTVVFHEGSTLVVVANSLRLLSFRA